MSTNTTNLELAQPAPRRRRVSGWLAVATALICAFGLRYVGVFASQQLDEPQGILSHIVFVGVALLAAAGAGLVGRIWATPAATIVLGVLAGLLATRFEDNLPGAAIGLLVGLLMATTLVWQVAHWGIGRAWGVGKTVGFGVLTGAGMGASWMVGGWIGPARAAGVALASSLVYLAFRDDSNNSMVQPSDLPIERPSARRPLAKLGFVAGWASGIWWLSEPLYRLTTGA